MPASSSVFGRLGFELPVLQAAMAGDHSNAELAAGVSEAGGLGSIGIRAPRSFAEEISRARSIAKGRPIAAGLLLPFTRRAHIDAVIAARPQAVILMDGFAPATVRELRSAGIYVIHQVGARSAAQRALRDGANALIAQGVEAGGHVLGVEPGPSLLAQVLEIAEGAPVLLAGGIATAQDVARALQLGAAAVVAGSRFILTHESGAHPAYKARILGAPQTVLTRLFGVGWTCKHRVVPNAATARWCDAEGRIPSWVALAQHGIERVIQPFAMLRDPDLSATRTSNALPFYTPASLYRGQKDAGVEATALYAGESVARVHAIGHAFEVTRQLAGR